MRAEDLVELDHRLHFVAGDEELGFGMSREDIQLDGVQQTPNLLATGRRPAFVLSQLDSLIAHLRDGRECALEVLFPIGKDRINQQSNGYVFLALAMKRRRATGGRGDEAAA